MSDDQAHDHPTPNHLEPGGATSAHHAEHGPIALGGVPEAEAIEAEDAGAVPVGAGPSPVVARPQRLRRVPPELVPADPRLFPPCIIDLRAGCYRITYRPNGLVSFYGTLRVEVIGESKVISGDLYRFRNIGLPFAAEQEVRRRSAAGNDGATLGGPVSAGKLSKFVGSTSRAAVSLGIPIYARQQYYSYLKITGVKQSPPFGPGKCLLTLTAEEYVYTQPPAGSFNGTFPAAPGSRTVQLVLAPKAPAPAGIPGPYFEGSLMAGGLDKGPFTMGWVSPSFRRATVEIDTLVGAVAPAAVAGSDIRSVFATAGWDLTVVNDQVNVPVPAGVTPTNCWTAGVLHNLMTSVRNPSTNLDKEWRLHLMVVPAKLGCGRGVMYDTIDVPREGVASFCDDGYPSGDSSFFGTAANQRQRDTPRAFLRSACHELGHGFNQVHQEGEGGADNSIMTTTPSVADILQGPATGAPGVFPDAINLAFNAHVRRHLVHWPDPLVRPGGHTFGAGHGGPAVPSPDRQYFEPDEMALRIHLEHAAIELGEPLLASWTLTNTSKMAIAAPSDISIEAQHATLSVTGPGGAERVMRAYVIRTDDVSIVRLSPGKAREASTRVYWSANEGFAFEIPGRHRLDLEIGWVYGGVSFGVRATAEVWLNYPQTAADNDAAALLLDEEVGKYVALGGDASHLTGAVARLAQLAGGGGDSQGDAAMLEAAAGGGAVDGAKARRGYEGILP